jgi:hypothetical protein
MHKLYDLRHVGLNKLKACAYAVCKNVFGELLNKLLLQNGHLLGNKGPLIMKSILSLL